MPRLTNEQLDIIKKENNVQTIYSWSRVNTFMTSKYEYFLHYVKHETPDRTDCIYTATGGLCHDVLEKYYENQIPYEKMIKEFEDGYDLYRNVLDLKFDRNVSDKDESLANRYYTNLHKFYLNHVPYSNDLIIEDPVQINVNGKILVGYIDAMYKDGDDYYILDFKSSSIYTGQTLTEHSGQLVLYAIGVSQMNNVPLNKIHIGFNFLKYCTIEYEQANGKTKEMNVERRLLGEKLQSPCKMWLKKFGYAPDDYLKQILDTEDISYLPLELQDKIRIKDCHVFIPLTEELAQYWTNLISNTIDEIEELESEYALFGDESIFYDDIDAVEKESYYYATLSEYSANKNVCYKKYLDWLEKKSQGADLFM